MKKITQLPPGPIPDAYKNNSMTQAEPDELAENINDEPVPPRCRRDVPSARYGKINLKKYASFKQTRCSIKLSNQEAIAMEQLTPWLQSVDVRLNSMNLELIADVASFCQAFFIYGDKTEREESIDRCVMECILPYCKNDEDVAKALLKSVSHRIVRSTAMSRRLSRMYNFFFAIVGTILRASAGR